MRKNDEIILEFFIILLIVKNMLQNSLYVQLNTIIETGIEMICYIFFAFMIIKYLKIEKWKIVFIFSIVIISCYTGVVTENYTILSSVIFVAITALLEDKNVIKISNKTIGYVLFVHIFIYVIQMIIGNVDVGADTSGRTRYLLGFLSPNTSGIFTLWWVAGKIYMRDYNKKNIFLYIGIGIIIYEFDKCRALLYGLIILFIISMCINKRIGLKTIKFFAKNIILIMSIVLYLIINLYNSEIEFAYKLDEIFSHRIFFSAQAIEQNGYTLIGQKINASVVEIGYYVGNIIMDVTYTALLYRYGIVYLIILILLSRYIVRTRSDKEYSLLIIYGIFAALELYSLNFIICFPMLFGAKWIGRKDDT